MALDIDTEDSEQGDVSATRTATLRGAPTASPKQPDNEEPDQRSEGETIAEGVRRIKSRVKELTSQETPRDGSPSPSRAERGAPGTKLVGRQQHSVPEGELDTSDSVPTAKPAEEAASDLPGQNYWFPFPRIGANLSPDWRNSGDDGIIYESRRYVDDLAAEKEQSIAALQENSPQSTVLSLPSEDNPDGDNHSRAELAAQRIVNYIAERHDPWRHKPAWGKRSGQGEQ